MTATERKRFRTLRGTIDVLPEEQPYWRHVRQTAVSVCERYSYGQIDTPILEDYGLFVRGVGEVTDIVEKEMYVITDKGGDTIALRPEATASVCRAYLEHGMHNRPQPVRLYSVGVPMFRYSRPQAGRLRQFHQLNVEAIGDADATIDAEVMGLCWQFFRELGLKQLSLLLNSIGDSNCRPRYVDALKNYYSEHQSLLCRDCQGRLHRNPLRLLDCKEPGCQPLIAQAPHSSEYLCGDCQTHFRDLTRYLKEMDVPFALDHRLVRGLDYYTRTVFEVQTQEKSQQNALGGGGRYDGLVQELGGSPTPGVGFAVGIERVVLNLKRQGIRLPALPSPKVFIAHVGKTPIRAKAMGIMSQLVQDGVPVVVGPAGKSLKAQLRQAGAMGVPYSLILGEQELQKGVVILRDMAKGEQREVEIRDVLQVLQ